MMTIGSNIKESFNIETAPKDAIEEEGLPADIRDLISEQKRSLRRSHDEIKAMRDMQKSVS